MSTSDTKILRILLLDEDESFLTLTKNYLTQKYQEQIKIDTLSDSTKVFDLIKEKNYDLLISDYEMPEKNGLEILEEIRKNPITSKFPVIIFTGSGREEIVIKALNLGANYYITKDTDIKKKFRELLDAIILVDHHNQINSSLIESEEKHRLIFQNENDAIMLVDLETNQFFDVNPAAEQIYGYNREEFLRLHINDLTVETEKTSQILKDIKAGDTFDIPFRINRKKDGTTFIVEFKTSVFKYENKNILLTIVRDITKKHKTEQKLIENEGKLKTERENLYNILNSLNLGVYVADKNFNILFVNQTMRKKFGQINNKKCYDYIYGYSFPCHECKLHEVLTEKSFHQERFSKLRGEYYDVFETSIITNNQPSKLAIYRDITKHVTAGIPEKFNDDTDMEKTRPSKIENELVYKTIFDSVEDAIMLLDREIIIDCNQAAIKLLGCDSKNDIIERSIFDFSPRIQPDNIPSFVKSTEKISAVYFGIPQRFIWRHERKDNRRMFDAEVKLKKITLQEKDLILSIMRPLDFIEK